VHTEWSYDTPVGASMVQSCKRAIALGVPAIAFTEHLDFTEGGPDDAIDVDLGIRRFRWISLLDVPGYLASVAECRERFPQLRIFSGIEAGESHLFRASAGAVVSGHAFDRILGSLHAVRYRGTLVFASSLFDLLGDHDAMRYYFAELLTLIEGSDLFEVLAHLDFPRRYWPKGPHLFSEAPFEEEYREVLRALASSGRVLEINTRTPLASVALLNWWREEGGTAVSFGSDAHLPNRVGDRFKLAVDIAEQAGFHPGRDRYDFWRV
jgi:histidinol-phosphatase (PHP family)